jgi:hypothetical protein
MLLSRGWTNVRPLLDGFQAWQRAGLPIEPIGPKRTDREHQRYFTTD